MTSAAEIFSVGQSARDPRFWNLMGCFERQAIAQYRARVNDLPLLAKEACLRELHALATPSQALPKGALGDTMGALLDATDALEGRATILAAQGLVLEQVRRSVYAAVSESPAAGPPTRELALAASIASAEVSSRCAALFAREVVPEARFTCLVEASDALLRHIDALGEEIDATFGDIYAVRFSQVVGDFVAELVTSCTSLGMERRKVLGHLSGALMGF